MSVTSAWLEGSARATASYKGLSVDGVEGAFSGVVEQLGRIHHEAEALDAQTKEAHPHLVDINDGVKRVSEELKRLSSEIDGIGGTIDEKVSVIEQIKALESSVKGIGLKLVSEPFRELFKKQEKWVAAGFDRRLVSSDPEAVDFAVSTRLIYTIGMFKKTADILDGDAMDIRNEGGVALFKVEGEWLPYTAFKDRIQYSEKEWRFVGWNYVHPQGFIPRDWAEYGEIYPIAQLTPAAYQKVKAHAEQFWTGEQPQIDAGVPKGYILQVMTTGRDYLPNAWWAKNFKEHFPEHGSARLITPEGLVYSFGTKMRLPDQEFLSHISSYLGTGISNVPTPDYEESRPSDDRLMTSIPITQKRFDHIIDFVNRANKGISFNFSRQNCVRFVSVILQCAGMDVNIRTSLHELLAGIVPRISDIPVVGKPLSALVTNVACAVSTVFDTLGSVFGAITPYPLKKIGECAVWAVTGVLQRVEALFWNTIGLCVLGAWKSIVPESRALDGDLPEVETFRQLISWSDLLTPDAIHIYYETKLKAWMRKQKTTLHFIKPEHGFCCLDPDKATFRSPLLA